MPSSTLSEPTVARAERLQVGLLAAAACVVLFADATTKELHGTAVFYASLVREIIDSGSWSGIFSDAHAYLLKPPLVIWSSVLSAKVFGLTNFGVTFVSRLAGVGCVVLTYLVFRRWWSHPVAWLAAFVMLTNSTFVQFTATLRMDSALQFGLMLSIAGWAWRESRFGAAALFGGITIAVLSKGPIGFACVPLVLCHAALLRRSPVRPGGWRWAWLLAPIALWYGWLAVLHGAAPFSELGADALRETAAPDLDRWQSVVAEYVVKPARRYWPWLPFMLCGFMFGIARAVDPARPRTERLNYCWVLLWAAAVVAGAIMKPDHGIRYFYPALPVFGLFAAIAVLSLARGRFPASLPAVLFGVLCSVLVARGLAGAGAKDTRAEIAAIRAALGGRASTLAIGGFPVPPAQARRQNTHRDWVHFYTGSVPEVLSWSQVRDQAPDFSGGVFLTDSRGHEAWLTEFDLEAKYVTSEMIYAAPK
jgi:4-amino-4-deoxy-L-arabinose transferase-like glycosyltransferase